MDSLVIDTEHEVLLPQIFFAVVRKQKFLVLPKQCLHVLTWNLIFVFFCETTLSTEKKQQKILTAYNRKLDFELYLNT